MNKQEYLKASRAMVNTLMSESLEEEYTNDYREQCASIARVLVTVCMSLEGIPMGDWTKPILEESDGG